MRRRERVTELTHHLDRLTQPNQWVIEVDALPGHEIEGRVASFAPASGSVTVKGASIDFN